MQTRTLPNTELTVSRACFGTMTFGGQTDEATAARMIDLCFDRGVNFLDTANVYTQGQSETILGNILKGRRQRCILASKAGNKTGDPPDAPPLSRRGIERSIELSLKRLQTDYLDLYYLHLPDYTAHMDETLSAMHDVVRSGKARYLAISNYAAWQVAQIFAISGSHGYRPPYVSQPMYNLLARGIEQEYVPFCKEYGLSMVVYNPLAGGMLTGKQHRERPLPGTRFDNNQMYLDRYWHPVYFDAVDEITRIAENAGRSMIDLSIGWLLHHSATDCVILGASKLAQLEENLGAFERSELAEDTVAELDAVWRKLRGVTPKYNR
jgi:1-deoxyxylulose-5-phosphate synthase